MHIAAMPLPFFASVPFNYPYVPHALPPSGTDNSDHVLYAGFHAAATLV